MHVREEYSLCASSDTGGGLLDDPAPFRFYLAISTGFERLLQEPNALLVSLDVLVFGKESVGLPPELLAAHPEGAEERTRREAAEKQP